MNTADRSISLMDVAIRRRFCFKEMKPDSDVFATSQRHRREVDGIELGNLLAGLNRRLRGAGIDRDRAIGHSYLLVPSDEAEPLARLRQQFRFSIIPLLEEYCYADRSAMRRVLGPLVDEDGVFNDDQITNAEFLKILNHIAAPDNGQD